MTTMKKLASLVLAMLMLLGMFTFASAEETTYSITVPDKSGHTYEVYQIFTGNLTETDGKLILTDVVWGENGTGETDAPVDDAVLAALMAVNTADATDQEKLAVIKQYVDLTGTALQIANGGETLADLPAGYYLIKDKDETLDNLHDSYTTYIVEVVKNITLTAKDGVPSLVKKVKDKNDTADQEESEWMDSADWDIGDTVPFMLESPVAANVLDYEVYKFIFHDTICEGLTVQEDSFDAYIVNSDGINETLTHIGSTYAAPCTTDGCGTCSFTVTIDDLLSVKDDNGVPVVNANSKIRVLYNATLNENAVIGALGNPNEARLEFSNNPNDATGNETGFTPTDKVRVFTYKVLVDKVDQEQNPLEGASFQLYKKNTAGEYVAIGDETYTVATDVPTDDGTEVRQIAVWEGLDDGAYKLEEIDTPEGYNSVEPIEFVISATHEDEADDPQLTVLEDGNTQAGTVNLQDGSITFPIINKSGTQLPTTGGIGTTIFYVVGGVLVLLAVVLLITKRRVGEEN